MGTYADGWNSWNAQYNQFATNASPQLVVFSGMWDSKVETFELMEYELAGDVAQALSEMRASNMRQTPIIPRTELEDVASAMDVDHRVRNLSLLSVIQGVTYSSFIVYSPLHSGWNILSLFQIQTS